MKLAVRQRDSQTAGAWDVNIESQLSGLPAAMRRVGEYILSNKYRASELNLERLAAETLTSKTTIVRFCQRLGYEGYKDFYAAWVSAISTGAREVKTTPRPTIAEAVFQETTRDLTRTLHLLDPVAMEKAATLIAQAPAVYFYGMGDSEGLALSAAHRFTILGKPARALSTIEALQLEGTLFPKEAVLCAISQSGFHPHSHAMNPVYAHFPSGERVIAVTSNAKSKLAKHAEVVLLTSASDLKAGDRTITFRACQLAVLDSLALAFGLTGQGTKLHGPTYQRLMKALEPAVAAEEPEDA